MRYSRISSSFRPGLPVSQQRDRGGIFIEATLSILFLLIMLFAVIDVGRIFLAHLTLQHAVRAAGRFGLTGRRLVENSTILSREISIERVLQKTAFGFNLKPGAICIYPTSTTCGGSNDAGGPDDFFTVTVSYTIRLTPPLSLFFSDQSFPITVGATFRNEMY